MAENTGSDPRPTGWEYLGANLDPKNGQPVSIADVMTQAVFNGLPENGGWELMLPWHTMSNGGVLMIFKRPISAIKIATMAEARKMANEQARQWIRDASPRGDGRNGAR